MTKAQKLILALTASTSCFLLMVHSASAHTKWNYYRSNYECRSEYGQGPVVDKRHCKTPNHTEKVCRAKDSHTHKKPGVVEGPGYIDTDEDGIADMQITDVPGAAANCPCTTVSDPGKPMSDSSATQIAPKSDGSYTQYTTSTDPETGTTTYTEDKSPIHEYPTDSAGSGSGSTDMTADDWGDITGN